MANDLTRTSSPTMTDAQQPPEILRKSPSRVLVAKSQSPQSSPTRTSRPITSSPPLTLQSHNYSTGEEKFYDSFSTPSQVDRPSDPTFGAASPDTDGEQDIAHDFPSAPKRSRFYERGSEHEKKRASSPPTLASGFTSPPRYVVDDDDEIGPIPLSVLATMIATHTHSGKLRKDADDVSMDTVEFTTNITFNHMKASLLVAAKRAFPRAVGIDVELCRWVGMSVGKPKRIFVHEVREDNHKAVLRMLLHARTGEFGLAVIPVYAKAPSVFERMRNLVPRSRSAKKRKLDDEESALHA